MLMAFCMYKKLNQSYFPGAMKKEKESQIFKCIESMWTSINGSITTWCHFKKQMKHLKMLKWSIIALWVQTLESVLPGGLPWVQWAVRLPPGGPSQWACSPWAHLQWRRCTEAFCSDRVWCCVTWRLILSSSHLTDTRRQPLSSESVAAFRVHQQELSYSFSPNSVESEGAKRVLAAISQLREGRC